MTKFFLLIISIQLTFAANPVFDGYYADPEGIVYGNKYWIFPTYSAQYENQTFFDAFSSYDMVNWTKHSRIIDTDEVLWAEKAMWAPAVLKKSGKFYFFFAANDVHEGMYEDLNRSRLTIFLSIF